MRQHQRRPRGGRSNNGHGSSSQSRKTNRHHVFDSNGPDGKIRGTAQQVYEKYIALARDAASGGDRVTAENHYQHAEHYFRLWSVAAEEEERWAAPGRSRFGVETDEAGYDSFEAGNGAADDAEHPAMNVAHDFGRDDDVQPMSAPRRAASAVHREPRAPRMSRATGEGRQPDSRRRENWRESRRDVPRTEQPAVADYDAPVDVAVREGVEQDAGGLYQERMNLDRVVSARRETRAPRAAGVRRERRPGPDAVSVGGQSPVAQLLSEVEAIREAVDA